MRIKLSLCSTKQRANTLLSCAQQSLTELAIAFGHSFLVRLIDYEELIDSFSKEDGIYILAAEETHKAETAKTLNFFAEKLNFSGLANVSLLKSNMLAKGSVLSPIDSSTSSLASFRGYLQAKKTDETALIKADEKILPVIEKLMFSPENMGDLICDYNAGSILRQIATIISGTQLVSFNILRGNEGNLYYVPLVGENLRESAINPYGLYFAISSALMEKYWLEKEALCLQTATANVLKAGWRTEDCLMAPMSENLIDTRELCSLIDEQIMLAGELMQD